MIAAIVAKCPKCGKEKVYSMERDVFEVNGEKKVTCKTEGCGNYFKVDFAPSGRYFSINMK